MTSTLRTIGTALTPTRRPYWPAYRKLLQSTDWPILVGPWRSELGFEAMYWIPFVQALGIDPKRLIPITRGGASCLYGCPQGFELYAMRDPKVIRIENQVQLQKTGMLKQTFVSDFDRAILKEAASAIGLKRYHVLHPAWMYQVLAPYWQGRRGLEWLWRHLMTVETDPQGVRHLSLKKLTAPTLPPEVKLPDKFVAARFYFRSTFPVHPTTIDAAKAMIRQVAAHAPVVLLNPGVHADEHIDLTIKDEPNVYTLKDLCEVTPENNLALQAAVIAKAQGFVGTYGGLSQLALRLGKPTVSVYLTWQGTALAHKYLADAIATASELACLVVRVGEIPLLKTVLPALQIAPANSSARVAQEPFVPRPQPVPEPQ